MILKSYLIEKDIALLDKYFITLIYGENIGMKDDIKNGFREYKSAKLEGESLCKSYNKKMKGNFFYPRIPPLDTDQNLSILPSKGNKASEYAFRIISLMEGQQL